MMNLYFWVGLNGTSCSLHGCLMARSFLVRLCCLLVFPVRMLVLPAYSGFLLQSKDVRVRLIGDSKLIVGINGCVSLCAGLRMDW